MNHYSIILLILNFLNCYSLIGKDELVEKLLYLVEQKSTYTSVSGDNLLLWKEGQFHCDCSGMIKALLNGFDIYNVKEGDKLSEFPVTGDKNSKQLIEGCIDVTDNFFNLNSVPRFLYLKDHIGVYIGKEVKCGNDEGDLCNVVECTSSWEGGIKLSYVDLSGNRYNKKGGRKEKNWLKNGLPTLWVQYDCKDITPEKTSDCQLSPEDKKSFKYCCITKNSFHSECESFTESEYQIKLIQNDALISIGMKFEFECITKEEEEMIKNPNTTDCESTKPKKSSDCLLSKEDQKYFKYCCFERIEGFVSKCYAYTQQTYEDELSYYELFNITPGSSEITFDCHTEIRDENNETNNTSNNSSRRSYISFERVILYLILILF